MRACVLSLFRWCSLCCELCGCVLMLCCVPALCACVGPSMLIVWLFHRGSGAHPKHKFTIPLDVSSFVHFLLQWVCFIKNNVFNSWTWNSDKTRSGVLFIKLCLNKKIIIKMFWIQIKPAPDNSQPPLQVEWGCLCVRPVGRGPGGVGGVGEPARARNSRAQR